MRVLEKCLVYSRKKRERLRSTSKPEKGVFRRLEVAGDAPAVTP
ncbi:MAG: hypothetical protein AB8V10_07990 [Francisella endosymbiont of Hyalomma asiaticum]